MKIARMLHQKLLQKWQGEPLMSREGNTNQAGCVTHLVSTAATNPEHIHRIEREFVEMGGSLVETFSDLQLVFAEVPVPRLLDLQDASGAADLHDADVHFGIPLPAEEVGTALNKSVPMISNYRGIPFPPSLPGTEKRWDGEGVRVAVLDTGIDGDHPALQGKVTVHTNFSSDSDAVDHVGHGSHCAGIIASGDSTYRGVAPGAELINVKVLNRYGSGSMIGVIRGLQYVHQQRYDIASMSLGGGTNCDGTCPVCHAVNVLQRAGITVVVAAGNSGVWGGHTINCPGASPGAVTVGAIDANRNLAYFSSRGPTRDGRMKPDLVAPGVQITSVRAGGGYIAYSGTSMATPHVAGAAALMTQQLRGKSTSKLLVSEEVRRALIRTERLPLPENHGGHGLVNLVRAGGIDNERGTVSMFIRAVGLGDIYRCACNPGLDLWVGWPGRISQCLACGGRLCPSCRRSSPLCAGCQRRQTG